MIDPDGDAWLRTVVPPLRARTRSILTAPVAIHRYWYVFHKVMAPPRSRFPDTVFACRELTWHDHHLLDEFPTPRWRSELSVWLDDPDVSLFVAFHGGRAVAYECVSLRVPHEAPFRAVHLADGEVWLRDVYALPGYRARGAVRALRAYRSAVMAKLGFCGTVSAVAEDRPALLAATYDAQTLRVDGLAHRRVLTFNSVRIDADARERLEERLLAARRRRLQEPPAARDFALPWSKALERERTSSADVVAAA